MITLSQEVTEALRTAEIGEHSVRLTGQLDRKVYVETNKVLERLGGAWNRKAKAHLFDRDPREALSEVLDAGLMPRDADKDSAFFRTPPAVVDRLMSALAPTVESSRGRLMALEPSAGDGAIANPLRWAWGGRFYVHCVEPDPRRAQALRDNQHHVFEMTFETFAADHWLNSEPHDVIVMNPPFATPGEPVLWAKHVLLAWDMLAPYGTLAAVVPNNIERQHKTVAQVRDLVEQYGWVEDLPETAFKESGTGVRTKLLVLERP